MERDLHSLFILLTFEYLLSIFLLLSLFYSCPFLVSSSHINSRYALYFDCPCVCMLFVYVSCLSCLVYKRMREVRRSWRRIRRSVNSSAVKSLDACCLLNHHFHFNQQQQHKLLPFLFFSFLFSVFLGFSCILILLALFQFKY